MSLEKRAYSPLSWTFLTNHAHVILCLKLDPDMRMRDVAGRIGITERAVQGIVADLVKDGYLEVERRGRANHYRLHPELHLRHPIEAGQTVAALFRLLSGESLPARPAKTRKTSV
jgi:predicted ArsR family transcriptional regulator